MHPDSHTQHHKYNTKVVLFPYSGPKAAHVQSSDLEDRDGGPSSGAPTATLSAETINSSVTLASVLILTKSIGKTELR